MNFEILELNQNNKGKWTNLINDLNIEDRDVHYLPDYCEIYENTYNYKPFLVFYGDRNNYVVQQYIKRGLNALPFLREQNIKEEFFDVTNPYGFSGPVFKCKNFNKKVELFKEFSKALCNYFMENKIASEFVSLHPLINNYEIVSNTDLVKLNYEKDVIVVNLTQNSSDIEKGFNRGNKSNINKARKLGIKIEKVKISSNNLNIFKNFYYRTMERKSASAKWFFPENFFENTFNSLGENRVSLFFAILAGSIISTYFIIHDYGKVYYHFGGSDSNYGCYRPNNLLMYEIILWAKEHGFELFHLGGGVTSSESDSLFQFKSSFSKNRIPLYSYNRINNSIIYDYLCELKKTYEVSDNSEIRNLDYFPLYRR